jgi:prevent-host-death family protein
MSVHTFSSRDFTRDVSAAKRAAADGPVFITDRGRPAFALLTIDEYHRLSGKAGETLFDVMNAIPGGDGIEFDPPRMNLVSQTVNFD